VLKLRIEFLLTIRDLGKNFGGIAALDGCSIDVAAGEIAAIIGPNGAGKSTLLNCVAGALKPDRGSVTYYGEDATGAAPHILAGRRLVRTFQISRELTNLSLLENVLLSNQDPIDESFFAPILFPNRVKAKQEVAIEKAMGLLRRVGLEGHANETASVLSGGQKKLLELARALMLDPKLVLLDEPAAGVAPPMVSRLVEVIRELNEEDVTFVLVEHNMDMVAALGHRVHVMAEGKNLVSGTFEEVTQDVRVVEAYLGGVI
jgi:ABC-type branched-subunit amino acid transport system ATPase component